MLTKVGSAAWGTLETALRLLEKSADACPPLKSAVGGLVACLDLTQVSYCGRFHIVCHPEIGTSQAVLGNHKEYDKLATELTDMVNALVPFATKFVADDLSDSVKRIMKWVSDPSPGIRS